MAEKILRKAKSELTTCSICLDTYTNPKLLQCFHVYCQGCLTGLVLQNKQRELVLACPSCCQITPLPADGVAGLQSAFHINQFLGITEVNKKGKNKSPTALQPVEKQVATIMQAREQLHACRRRINDQQATIEADIHKTIVKLGEIVTTRKVQLLDDLHQITERKLKSLAAQEDQLEVIQTRCLYFMRKIMDTDCNIKESRVAGEVKNLATLLQPDLLTPCTDSDLLYQESVSSFAECQNFGSLSFQERVDPSKCCATGNGLEVAIVDEKCTVILHTVNCQGEACVQPITILESELISEIAGTRVFGWVDRMEQSKHEISYQPTIKGRHHLHIKVNSQHIRGSPFSVAVKSSIQKLGTPFHSIRGVNGPYGVALTHKQELVVSGHRDHCVNVFSPDGKKLVSFGSSGSGKGQFINSMGVAVDKDGNIFVVDRGNHRVQKFTAEGHFITAAGIRGQTVLRFDTPYGIAFNTSNNKVYVLDSCNFRVQVLNSNLTFYTLFGSRGRQKGQFMFPRGIACDSTGQVYIADTDNDRIQVFTAEGRFFEAFGERALNKPCGVAVGSNDMVYISEGGNHRVSVFTTDGEFVKAFGGVGSEPGQFQHPRGLAVDSNGVVFVCDKDNNCIQMF